MKSVLIAGADSYIGMSTENWLLKHPDKYYVETINMEDESWREVDFSRFDVVFHVAGIVHRKEQRKNVQLYYRVNRDLAYEVARFAKQQGVSLFILMSSMSVYGVVNGVIEPDTAVNPKNHYGKSKLQAERLLTTLEDDSFGLAIVRAPVIYGRGCKGNYAKLSRLAKTTPIFPEISNKRSMIYIDSLCEFVRLLINKCRAGVFFPQNTEYICTSELVKLIANLHGKSVVLTKLFNPFLHKTSSPLIRKVFGNLTYSKEMSSFEWEYEVCSFTDSVRSTEVR